MTPVPVSAVTTSAYVRLFERALGNLAQVCVDPQAETRCRNSRSLMKKPKTNTK